MSTLEVIVRGRVQGVGFRYFVLDQALARGIQGEVWNRRDGGVELFASHDDLQVLEEFVRSIHHGPGRVDSVSTFPGQASHQTGFRIGDSR